MELFSDVVSNCRQLNSEKVTDRKKAAERLTFLLKKPSVIQILDKNTDEQSREQHTWNSVFKDVAHYVDIEIANLQKGKEPQSAAAISNREKKKSEIFSLYKLVIQFANKRGPRIKGSFVIRNVMDFLKDDFKCTSFGIDCSNILIKEVLTVRKYWTAIASNDWYNLIALYCSIFNEEDTIKDPGLLSRVIYHLLNVASSQCELRTKRLLNFFKNFFKNLRNKSVIENILKAMNAFVKNIIFGARLQVCKLGEDIEASVLHLWESRPSACLKENLIIFLNLQMKCHHPGGVSNGHSSALACNWADWEAYLQKLYAAISSDLLDISGRKKFSGGSKDADLSAEYIELAASVCHQVFRDASNIDGVCKGWQSIWEIFVDSQQVSLTTLWLNVLKCLFEKYPDSIPSDEIISCLKCVLTLINESKRPDIMSDIFPVLQELVHICSTRQLSAQVVEQGKTIWKKIWASTFRSVSLHNAMGPGFSLMQHMILTGMATPSKDFWSLFVPSLTSPSKESVAFLLTVLQTCNLPENFQSPLYRAGRTGEETGICPLRQQLIEWLLSWKELGGRTEKLQTSPNLDELGQCLVFLIQKRKKKSSKTERREIQSSDVEQIFLEASHHLSSLTAKNDNIEDNENGQITYLALFDKTEALVKDLLSAEGEKFENPFAEMVIFSKLACFLGKFMYFFLKHKIVTLESAKETKTFSVLKDILKKLSGLFCDVSLANTSTHQSTMYFEALEWMKKMLDFDTSALTGIKMARIVRALLPEKIIDILLSALYSKGKADTANKTRCNVSLGGGRPAKRSRILVDMDDDDMDFDLSAPDKTMDVDDEDEFDAPVAASQEYPQEGLENQSLLDTSKLPMNEKLRIISADIVCSWCGFDKTDMLSSVSWASDLNQSTYKTKIEALLDEDVLDTSKPGDLQLMERIITNLTLPCHHLPDSLLENMLNSLTTVCRKQKKDQEICCLCLDLLNRLLPYLACSPDDVMVSEIMAGCRNVALGIISGFWTLKEGEQCSPLVRLSLQKSLHCLLKVDPKGNWSKLLLPEDAEVCQINMAFAQGLSDTCHRCRMFTTNNIMQFFVYGEDQTIPQEKSYQNKMFDVMFNILSETIDLQAANKISAERFEDEKSNRRTTVLTALLNVMRYSPVCRKKALFALCQLTKEHAFDVKLVMNMIGVAAKDLGYSSQEKYVEDHLPYLIHEWLGTGYLIEDFPCFLLSFERNEEFFKKFYTTIIPELIMSKQITEAKSVVSVMQGDWKECITQCILKIMMHIYPLFAASKSEETAGDELVKRRTEHAIKSFDLLTQEVTKEVVQKTISQNLDEIVVNILMCLYDVSNDEFMAIDVIRNMDPEPNPPSFNTYMVTSTLDHITNSFQTSNKSLVGVLSRKQDYIQKILLQLALKQSHEHRLHEIRRLTLVYRVFVKLILKDFTHHCPGNWAYVVRETIHRTVYIIESMQFTVSKIALNEMPYRDNIAYLALELLRDIYLKSLDICPLDVEKYLPMVVNCLVQLSEKGNEIGKKATEVLNTVIVEHYDVLREGISLLDPFPDNPCFIAVSEVHRKVKYGAKIFSLQQEIQMFLSRAKSPSTTYFRKEGIIFLSKKIADHPDELLKLVNGSGDDKNCSLLYDLVCSLVTLAKRSSADMQLSIAKCLGELGPINLRTVTWQTMNDISSNVWEHSQENDFSQQYCIIFNALDIYLTDRDLSVVEAASSVLKDCLATKSGSHFLEWCKKNQSSSTDISHFIQPFKTKKVLKNVSPKSSQTFQEMVDIDGLWVNEKCYSDWIRTLTCTLIASGAVRNEVMSQLELICAKKTDFCEQILPILIHDILSSGTEFHRNVLTRQISNFFAVHCQLEDGLTTSKTSTGENTSICLNKDAVKCLLIVLQYLRQQKRPKQGNREMTAWDNNFWLDVNYLQVAKAGLFCSALFTTVMYTEIWFNCQIAQGENSSRGQRGSQRLSGGLSQNSCIDSVSQASLESGINAQDLLLQAYQSIGDPDGIYGCGAGRLADTSSRIKTYQHENKWDKSVIAQDICMETDFASSSPDLVKALQRFGTVHIMNMYINGIMSVHEDQSTSITDMQYELAWKAGQWNMEQDLGKENVSFHQSVFQSLSAIKDGHKNLAFNAIEQARHLMLQDMLGSSLESSNSLLPFLSDLSLLAQIDTCIDFGLNQNGEHCDLLQIWSQNLSTQFIFKEFCHLQPALNARIAVLRLLSEKGQNEAVSAVLQEHLLFMCRVAREEGFYQVAERAMFELKAMDSSVFHLHVDKLIEESRLFWARNEQTTAKHLLKNVLSELKQCYTESNEALRYYANVLNIYGNWLSETRAENSNTIMEDFLQKSADMMSPENGNDDVILNSYMSLARYADSQYQGIVDYMKSSTFESKQNLMKKARSEIQRMKSIGDCSKDRYFRILDKQQAIDEQETKCMEEDKLKFLVTAVNNYLKCLLYGDKHDLRLFRLTSLWINNSSVEQITSLVKENFEKLQTYKFLPLMHQLAARMDNKPSNDSCKAFQDILMKILETTTLDHPHHSLFCILALANATKDYDMAKEEAAAKRGRNVPKVDMVTSDQRRIEAAKALVQKLSAHKGNNSISDVVQDMDRLCTAYIQLANKDVNAHRNNTGAIPMPKDLMLLQMQNFDQVALPTLEIPINKDGRYNDLITISRFDTSFKLAGGLNLPKIISCIGSDGKKYKQLVKGRDDLRQDAVMQQVFGMVNNLLQKDPSTHKRQLKIRRYKVIPLSQCSGILEWCEGTVPIGNYLVGGGGSEKDGAHYRYSPSSPTAFACRKKMAEQLKSGDFKKKYKAFMEICESFPPVFRHFFSENFPDPSLWYERRLMYTKSVATTSIVGYILGLGDRHVQNILVDTDTAEFVHIDLGVAFEQGRILPTPETVPFRLTRDVVDGMGISGVEGVFRRCCEKTMEVMHSNQETLMTILEVLLYDPLSSWSMSPAKAYALQQRRDKTNPESSELNLTATKDILEMADAENKDTENVNKQAERVLLRLQQKLQGIEDGMQLSISGQVNLLIQAAKDPKNLCQLFPGWQPYL